MTTETIARLNEAAAELERMAARAEGAAERLERAGYVASGLRTEAGAALAGAVAVRALVALRLEVLEDARVWYPCACGAEHNTPTCPF